MNEALIRIYKECYPRFVAWVLDNSGSTDEAKEAYAEAWKRVLLRLRDGQNIDDYGAYIYVTACNIYIRERKDRGLIVPLDTMMPNHDDEDEPDEPVAPSFRELSDTEPEPEDEPDATSTGPPSQEEDPLQNPDNWGVVGECLTEMTLDRQQILKMALIEGLTDAQIAEKRGTTPGTIANAKSRALDDLRNRAAKRLHERGNSFFLKVLTRKKSDKEARKSSQENNPSSISNSHHHPPSAGQSP